jgi:hypothetical protein
VLLLVRAQPWTYCLRDVMAQSVVRGRKELEPAVDILTEMNVNVATLLSPWCCVAW